LIILLLLVEVVVDMTEPVAVAPVDLGLVLD
jgi:hypothetical protein